MSVSSDFFENLRKFVNMKHSIDFLPQYIQRELQELVGLIREEVKDVVMVILYGSYAKNTYARHDVHKDYGGGLIEFNSDYDLFVVTKRRLGRSEGTVETHIRDKFAAGKQEREITKIQIVSESISKLNNALSEGRYFYADVINEGVMLYDTGEYALATPRALNFAEIKEMAAEYYEEKLLDATRHFQHFELDYSHPDYKFCAFDLHQVAECLIKAVPLVYVLYGHKEHDLKFLLRKSKCHTLELVKVFSLNTEEEKRLFDLLRRAYLEARYNKKKFIVTKADIDALLPKIEQLRDAVERVCKERLAYYDSRIEK